MYSCVQYVCVCMFCTTRNSSSTPVIQRLFSSLGFDLVANGYNLAMKSFVIHLSLILVRELTK